MKKINPVSAIIIICFFSIIGWYSVSNFPVISKSISDFIEHRSTLRKLNEDLTAEFKSDDLFRKDDFINLNGLYGKISRRRLFNSTVLMKNGMVTPNRQNLGLSKSAIEKRVNSLVDFSNYVSEQGADFFYVQLPAKYDMSSALLPDGHKTNVPKDTEKILKNFSDAGINIIDLLPVLTTTEEEINLYFYKTDHHWKPSGAFKAFQTIMEYLQIKYPKEPYSSSVVKLNNWTIHDIPIQNLGSMGKRVGKYYVGMDSLQWMTPNFYTNLSLYIPKDRLFYKGDYSSVFIRDKYLQDVGDIFHTEYYFVYIGKNYPLTQTRNINAMSSQKLLIIDDSFDRPLQTFFSMVFREVDTLDPRLYGSGTIKEYVNQTKPDLVMLALHSNGIVNDEFFSFSNDEDVLLSETKRILLDESATHDIDDSIKYLSFYKNEFENEKYYTVNIQDIRPFNSDTESISVVLYDVKKKKKISETMLDIEFCNFTSECEWTFRTPDSGSSYLELRLYSGSNNVDFSVGNIKLCERELVKND